VARNPVLQYAQLSEPISSNTGSLMAEKSDVEDNRRIIMYFNMV